MGSKKDQFFVFVKCKISDELNPIINVLKLTFDKINYFDLPQEYNSINHHPLISNSSIYNNFLREINDKIKSSGDKIIGKSYIRNLNFKILNSKKETTPEALEYLSDDYNYFGFKGVILEKEKEYLSDVNKTNELSTKNLFNQCESLDKESNEDQINQLIDLNSTAIIPYVKPNFELDTSENNDLPQLNNKLQSTKFSQKHHLEPPSKISKINSSTFDDITKLKNVFGTYQVCNPDDLEPETWFSKVFFIY